MEFLILTAAVAGIPALGVAIGMLVAPRVGRLAGPEEEPDDD
jgi:hypothetical protein